MLGKSEKKFNVSERMARLRQISDDEKDSLEDSGVGKNLPEDSFDESITKDEVVEEDDMFDIYKDHEADEFGHKKYEPEEILVKVKDDSSPTDYLSECEKLKEEILKRKTKQEESLESLVKALDSAHLDKADDKASSSKDNNDLKTKVDGDKVAIPGGYSMHMHKHLLATIGRHG